MATNEMTRWGVVYMQLRDRRKMASLMIVNDVSQRQLAAAAGWGPNSHSFVARLLHGTANAVTPESAVRIAYRLDVPVDALFLTKLDTKPEQANLKSKTQTTRKQS